MKKGAIFVMALLGACALAWGFQERTLFINGKKAAKGLVVQGGEMYVPVSELRAAGVEVTVAQDRLSIQFTPLKGQNQSNLVEGIPGEFVNNGTWRLKVGAISKIKNPFGPGEGYEVEVEFRNASNARASLHGTGIQPVSLIDSLGNTLSIADSSFNTRFSTLAPGQALPMKLKFGPARSGTTIGDPDKLMVTFRAMGGKAPLKGFRIDLKAK